jgi:hypothetical protein
MRCWYLAVQGRHVNQLNSAHSEKVLLALASIKSYTLLCSSCWKHQQK